MIRVSKPSPTTTAYWVIASDVDLLRDLDGIVDLDAEVTDCSRFWSAQAGIAPHVGFPSACRSVPLWSAATNACRTSPDQSRCRRPFLHEPGILPRREPPRAVTAAGEQELTWLAAAQPQVLVDCHTSLTPSNHRARRMRIIRYRRGPEKTAIGRRRYAVARPRLRRDGESSSSGQPDSCELNSGSMARGKAPPMTRAIACSRLAAACQALNTSFCSSA